MCYKQDKLQRLGDVSVCGWELVAMVARAWERGAKRLETGGCGCKRGMETCFFFYSVMYGL